MRERFRYLLMVGLAMALVGIALLAGTSPATGSNATDSTLDAASDYWRYGVAASFNYPDNSAYVADLVANGVRWYHNWHFNASSGMAGLTFYPQALREFLNDGCYMTGVITDGITITNKINSNLYPNGTTWLIGNEVGATYNPGNLQNYTPDQYAQIYHRCYELIKGINPASPSIAARHFKVANGGVLPLSSGYNFSPPSGVANNGLNWMRAAQAAYLTRYGTYMPIDVYNIHLYESPTAQGYAAIQLDVTNFRNAMANEWNDRQKPLMASEIGIIPDVGWQAATDHLNRVIDYLNSTTSASTGYSADNNKLVQQWAWFTVVNPGWSSSDYNYTALYTNASTHTQLGNAYFAKAQAAPTSTPLPSGTPTATRTPTNTPTPTNTRVILPYEAFINAGGPQYVDSSNFTWVADRAYSAANQYGYTTAVNSNTYANAVAIAGTTDDALYQTERYWVAANGGYRFDVPNGQYQVDLRFAEIYHNAANKRVFDVLIEGVAVASSLDIFASVGPKTALDLSYNVTVSDGHLDVSFRPIKDTAKVNAIHIMPLGAPGTATRTATPANTRTSTRTPTAANTGTRTNTPTITNTPANTATRTNTPTPTNTSPVPPYDARLDAGGPQYTDGDGNIWLADRAYSAANRYGYTTAVNSATYGNPVAIADTTDDTLYQTERYWTAGGGGYRFDVPNGNYQVDLRFAEIYGSTPIGGRVFDVLINGVTVYSNLDVRAAAGGTYRALDLSFNATVSAGQLLVTFSKDSASGPAINAIHVLSLGPQGTATPTATRTNTGTRTNTPTITNTPVNTATRTNTPTPTNTSVAPAYSVRLNTGGPQYTDTSGRVWLADRTYSAANTYGLLSTGNPQTYSTGSTIAGTVDDTLYQTERYWAASGGGYRFDVPNGNYQVNLKFAEIYGGTRVFDIVIQGVTVYSNLNIRSLVGMYTALDLSFPATVSNGQLLVTFTLKSSTPKLSAIEVVRLP